MHRYLLLVITLSALTLAIFGKSVLAAQNTSTSDKSSPAFNSKIHTYTATADTFYVNSYLIETRNNIILVDTQMTISEAGRVKTQIERIGKPLAAIFITDPHPDHYNNIGVFLDKYPDIPVYSTKATLKEIRETDSNQRGYWRGFYPGNYPTKFVLPNKIVNSGDSLQFDDVTLQIDEVFGGESGNQMIIYLPSNKTLFVGDLVYSGVYANAREGHTKDWLKNLEKITKKYSNVEKVYPGHGAPGMRDILTKQIAYLSTLRDLIRPGLNKDNPTNGLFPKVERTVYVTMTKNFPYECFLLLELSIEPIHKELLEEAGFKTTPNDPEDEE